jgi:alanyl-tRNA synthetase
MAGDKKALINVLRKDWEKYWKVDLFKEKGFTRKQCKCCGKFFWSLNETDVCSDADCLGYVFLDKQMGKKMDYFQAWEAVRDFFVKNGHVPLERYPTICKWYPLYFTIAGIVDFYRIAGKKITFEFPANPVILSQPCLRFNDISNVGKTGRHYTCFDMIQQSSVYDGKKGYWKDHCIELNYELMTKVMRVKPEDLIYTEDVWVGQGAFGYCLEFFVGGLEMGNNVFTEFEGDFNNYSVMKERVIDMGAGLARFAWLGNRTPMSYDVVFGNLVEKMVDKAGISYDKELFRKYARFASKLNFEEVANVQQEKVKIAQLLGVSEKELFKQTETMEKIYAIADHSKALLFGLADGGLPSNVGGGYNLRIILRRAMNFIEQLGSPFEMEWIIEEQAKYLRRMNPELVEKLDHINKIIDSEKKKYSETKSRVRDTIDALIKSKTKLDENKLMELYDSQGISPDLLKEVDADDVLKIKIPEDFYLKITDKHLLEKEKAEKKLYDVSGIEATKKLFYEDQKMSSFKANVLKVDGDWVILDKTAFFPRGGGQEPDLGTINGCKVYDVEREENVILHKVENPRFKAGCIAECKLDFGRRWQLTKHHTATHLINGAARKLLGEHIWQAGSKKDVDKAHLDITHYDILTDEQLRQIEKIVNDTIAKKLKVNKELLPRTEAENKYGFVLYQGGVVPETMLRVISVKNYDAEACGGMHVDNTCEVEEVFIFNSRRMQDGIIRLEYVAGKELVEKTRNALKEKESLSKERLEKKLEGIKKEKEKVKSFKENLDILVGVNYVDTEDMKELEIIGRKSVEREPENFSVLIGNGVVFGIRGAKSKADISKIAKEAARTMGGSAGGRENELKGGGPLKDKGKEAYERAKAISQS